MTSTSATPSQAAIIHGPENCFLLSIEQPHYSPQNVAAPRAPAPTAPKATPPTTQPAAPETASALATPPPMAEPPVPTAQNACFSKPTRCDSSLIYRLRRYVCPK